METKYFDNGFVGKKVDDAAEAVMLYNAGMDIRNQYGYGFLWCNDNIDEEPTAKEITSRIIEYIKENGFVYAGFELDGQKVVKDASTILSCDVQKEQTVYFLHGDVIENGVVKSISMRSDKLLDNCFNAILQRMREYAPYINDIRMAMNFLDQIDDIAMLVQRDFVSVQMRDEKFRHISLNKVFASKEDLISNLIINAK